MDPCRELKPAHPADAQARYDECVPSEETFGAVDGLGAPFESGAPYDKIKVRLLEPEVQTTQRLAQRAREHRQVLVRRHMEVARLGSLGHDPQCEGAQCCERQEAHEVVVLKEDTMLPASIALA